jgi:DNA-binding NarL/FixJ family response regulator
MSSVRTLVVDDVDEFRNFLCLTLQDKCHCEIVGEASDGLQAVQQAEKLLPDLILLDLSLPKLNGMEACRRIRRLSPLSKIIVLSQDSSQEVVRGALRLGAVGYLLKSDATELPQVLDAILKGTVFVSTRLKSS